MLDFLVANQPLLFFGIIFTMAFGFNILLFRLNLPHVLFYLAVGVIAGNILFSSTINSPEIQGLFHFVEIFTLGLIGFQIGTELHIRQMSQEPKFILLLLFSNIVGSFIFTYFIVFAFTGSSLIAIILGALSTSTAPATTVGVIKKLQSKGLLTTRIQWLLALNDVSSVAIVEAVLVISIILLGGHPSISSFAIEFGREIGIALILGLFVGLILDYIVERMDRKIEMMEISFAIVLMTVGLAEVLHTSAIATTMVIGAVATNRGGDNYKDAHDLLDILMSPILALFFILIGAKVALNDFYNPFPWLTVLYFLSRLIGKVIGSYVGATSLGIKEPMRMGLSMSLLAQGGIVLALASRTAEIFTEHGFNQLGVTILSTIIMSTILSEIVGAFSTDFAIKKNGEHYRINEEA
ncbi:MAG: cation:proton antiporter [Candidatus Heimdallarchaeota archaeon]|nr:cation:proton antiporter [Candidatus Heimdallarchaeota archaeon]MDH5647434.1 cation:proton antiporter [Candidatus Heimdallarchaeota archaeon]